MTPEVRSLIDDMLVLASLVADDGCPDGGACGACLGCLAVHHIQRAVALGFPSPYTVGGPLPPPSGPLP